MTEKLLYNYELEISALDKLDIEFSHSKGTYSIITAKDIKQSESNIIGDNTRPSTDYDEIKDNDEHDKSKKTASKISKQDDSSSKNKSAKKKIFSIKKLKDNSSANKNTTIFREVINNSSFILKDNRSPFSGRKSDFIKRTNSVPIDLYQYYSEYKKEIFFSNFPGKDFEIFQKIFCFNSSFGWRNLFYDCNNETINFVNLYFGIKPSLEKIFKFLLKEIPNKTQRSKKITDENNDGENVLKFVEKYFKNNQIDENLFLISKFDNLFNIKIDIDDRIEYKFCFKIIVREAKKEFLKKFHDDFKKRYAAKDYFLINSIEFEFNNEQSPEITFEPIYVNVEKYYYLHVDHPLKYSCLKLYIEKTKLKDNTIINVKNTSLELEENLNHSINNKPNFHEKNYINYKNAIQTENESTYENSYNFMKLYSDSNLYNININTDNDLELKENSSDFNDSKFYDNNFVLPNINNYKSFDIKQNGSINTINDLVLKENSYDFSDSKPNSVVSSINDKEIPNKIENVKMKVSQKNSKKSISSKVKKSN